MFINQSEKDINSYLPEEGEGFCIYKDLTDFPVSECQ